MKITNVEYNAEYDGMFEQYELDDDLVVMDALVDGDCTDPSEISPTGFLLTPHFSLKLINTRRL